MNILTRLGLVLLIIAVLLYGLQHVEVPVQSLELTLSDRINVLYSLHRYELSLARYIYRVEISISCSNNVSISLLSVENPAHIDRNAKLLKHAYGDLQYSYIIKDRSYKVVVLEGKIKKPCICRIRVTQPLISIERHPALLVLLIIGLILVIQGIIVRSRSSS